MAKEEEPGFEPLGSARLPEELHHALQNSLLLILQFGAWHFPLAECQGALEFGFKAVGIGQIPCF
jgi:hypothetical protein